MPKGSPFARDQRYQAKKKKRERRKDILESSREEKFVFR